MARRFRKRPFLVERGNSKTFFQPLKREEKSQKKLMSPGKRGVMATKSKHKDKHVQKESDRVSTVTFSSINFHPDNLLLS